MTADIVEKLQKIPIFKELAGTPESFELLARICKRRKYKSGETIISEGELGAEMFIVFSGSVEITKRTRAGDHYTVVILNSEQNVFFGELAMIDDDKRSATVSAREDSEFLVITKQDFLDLGNEHPSVGLPVTREIARILASRLRKTTTDMMIIFDALVNELQG
jgi:CRP/FNR family transcriptional regulator, cyclic AMP receptor protein